jgi:hypothetical protein
MNFAATTKQEVICELRVQLEVGLALLRQPVRSHDELARASMDRASWSLKNKKLLQALLGDSTGLAAAGARGEELDAMPTLEQEVAQFRRMVTQQLAYLEKVSLLLQRLA